jgi:hypothetical protein
MGKEASNELVKFLSPQDRTQLDEIVQEFCEMINRDDIKFPITCFFETHQTDFRKVIQNLPDEFVKKLDKDYRGLVRPLSTYCT